MHLFSVFKHRACQSSYFQPYKLYISEIGNQYSIYLAYKKFIFPKFKSRAGIPIIVSICSINMYCRSLSAVQSTSIIRTFHYVVTELTALLEYFINKCMLPFPNQFEYQRFSCIIENCEMDHSVMTSQINARCLFGDTSKIYMNDYGRKFFKGLYLSKERKYRALTYRYSFNISKRALLQRNLENYLNIVCTHLFNLLKPYL